MKVTFWSWTAAASFTRYAVTLLRSLGYRVSTKTLGDNYFPTVQDSRNKAQIGFFGWEPDYPAASAFFPSLFSCASFLPGNRNSLNAFEFCDRRIDREIKQALTEQATNPDAARRTWERVDRETVDQAAWVPLYTPKSVDVLSKRVGNYQYSPSGGVLFDQLWVR
jgi:peptide/nickel transport system substrate-binding protein